MSLKPEPIEPTITLPVALVEEVIAALRQSYSAVLVVRRGSIDEPYSDEPRMTPYTRFMRPAGRRAHDACGALTRAVVDAGLERPAVRGELTPLVVDGKASRICDFCAADEPPESARPRLDA